jgi:hypothetical protein
MYNDSIETLMLRHYGSTAPTPPALEQQLAASVHQEAAALQRQERVATRMRTQRVSRRQVVRWVAIGSAGVGLLSAGLESLHMLETSITGEDAPQMRSAFS